MMDYSSRVFILFEDQTDSKRFYDKIDSEDVVDITPNGNVEKRNLVVFRIVFNNDIRFFMSYPSQSLERSTLEDYKKYGGSIKQIINVELIIFEKGLTDIQFNDKVNELITFMEL